MFMYCFFFFFSSRRRHTRSKRDWSSDVCSSDLCSAMIRYQRAWAFPCSLPENRTRNDESLGLSRPFIDLRDALVSIQLLHDVIFDESVPAVDLNRGVDGSMGRLRREEFRDAGFVGVPLSKILQARGAIG